tara:strand:- start:1950 stop:2444 length:495 start_codon:yes stop_codon:yes gene_type:complete
MNKRGQGVFGMSFGMIFSIIVIIAIIGVAFYVITFFLDLGNCSEIGFFYDDLQEEVDRAWQGGASQDVFSKALPSGISHVCFGDLNTAGLLGKDEEIRDELFYSVRDDMNVYMYPSRKACDGDLAYYDLEHVSLEGFFCVEPLNGKVEVKISKEVTDALVKVEK